MSKSTYICPQCGAEFQSRRAGQKRHYCSLTCLGAARRNDGSALWGKVEKSDGCWLWTGHTARGYGRIRVAGKIVTTHRLSYELAYGPIPDDLCVCHTCDNPRCVRPDHLFLATNQENTQDKVQKGREAHPTGPRPNASGERNHHAKLTWELVREIRARHIPNSNTRELAREFGLSRVHIQAIVNYKVWKNDPLALAGRWIESRAAALKAREQE